MRVGAVCLSLLPHSRVGGPGLTCGWSGVRLGGFASLCKDADVLFLESIGKKSSGMPSADVASCDRTCDFQWASSKVQLSL